MVAIPGGRRFEVGLQPHYLPARHGESLMRPWPPRPTLESTARAGRKGALFPMSTVTSRPNRDARPFTRAISAILMPVGPAAVALLRLLAQDDTRAGERAAADSGDQIWLILVGWIAL